MKERLVSLQMQLLTFFFLSLHDMANPQLFFVLAKVSVPQLRILYFFFLFPVNRPIEMQIIQIKGRFVPIFDYINLVGNQFNMDPVQKELS